MKKTRKIFTVLVLSVAMILPLLCTQAFAADTKTVQINGYSAEDLPNAKPQLEISNILSPIDLDRGMKITAKTDEGDDLWTKAEYIDAAYNAAAPVTIKTLDDGGVFEVYKLKQTGNIFRFDFDASLPYSAGKLSVDDGKEGSKTINAGDLSSDDYVLSILSGCSVTLTEPGCYYVQFRYDVIAGSNEVFINVGGDTNTNPTTPVAVKTAPAASKIMVNGKQTAFDAYVINDANYFKLRDFALAVNGTDKQFEVTFDGTRNAILLTSRTPYTTVGGELAAGDGKAKDAVPCASKIVKDGTEIALEAYTIGGYNYFRLRDLAKAFNIGVSWSGEANTVAIDTSTGYTD